jgi:hypothetical protein
MTRHQKGLKMEEKHPSLWFGIALTVLFVILGITSAFGVVNDMFSYMGDPVSDSTGFSLVMWLFTAPVVGVMSIIFALLTFISYLIIPGVYWLVYGIICLVKDYKRKKNMQYNPGEIIDVTDYQRKE